MTRVLLRVVGLFLAEFVLLRLVIPDLVNMHDNLALVGAVVGLVLAIALAVWTLRSVLSHVTGGKTQK